MMNSNVEENFTNLQKKKKHLSLDLKRAIKRGTLLIFNVANELIDGCSWEIIKTNKFYPNDEFLRSEVLPIEQQGVLSTTIGDTVGLQQRRSCCAID